MSQEHRFGFSFNNPELTTYNGFGSLVTADEIRDNYMFGLNLVSVDGLVITDDQINNWIENAIGILERDINMTLVKKQIYHRPAILNGVPEVRSELQGLVEDIDFEYEDPYDFDKKNYNEYIFIKLRKRPILELQKCEFRDLMGNLIADITTWQKVNHQMGSVEFFPYTGALFALPLFVGGSFLLSTSKYNYDNYPDAYFLDYTAGFPSALSVKKRYPELLQVVGYLTAILVMIEMGEGRLSGIASSSLSLDGISESFTSTASAENSQLSAKMKNAVDFLKQFWNKNKLKYSSGLLLASL